MYHKLVVVCLFRSLCILGIALCLYLSVLAKFTSNFSLSLTLYWLTGLRGNILEFSGCLMLLSPYCKQRSSRLSNNNFKLHISNAAEYDTCWISYWITYWISYIHVQLDEQGGVWDTTWCNLMKPDTTWCNLTQPGATWCNLMQPDTIWCNLTQPDQISKRSPENYRL